ncbi:hypothetical protein L9F63_022312, partial [Diploptera punctata]
FFIHNITLFVIILKHIHFYLQRTNSATCVLAVQVQEDIKTANSLFLILSDSRNVNKSLKSLRNLCTTPDVKKILIRNMANKQSNINMATKHSPPHHPFTSTVQTLPSGVTNGWK